MSAVAPSRPHFQRRFVGVPPVLRASGMATRGSWSSHDHRCLHASVDSLILPSVPRYLRRRRRGFSAPRLPIDAAIQLLAPLFAAIAAAAVASVAAAPAASVAVTAASVVAAAATAAAVATVAPVAAAAVAVVVADTAGVPVVTAAAAYVDGAAAVATSAAVAIGNFCRGCCRCRCRRRRPLSCPSHGLWCRCRRGLARRRRRGGLRVSLWSPGRLSRPPQSLLLVCSLVRAGEPHV